jgi:hypothetical protein
MRSRCPAISSAPSRRSAALARALAAAANEPTVLGAVVRAQKARPGLLLVLPSALASASETPYTQPDRVEAALLALADVARLVRAARKSKRSAGTLEQLFLQHGLTYKAHISRTTAGRYGAEYSVWYRDKFVSIAPHFTLGKGGPKTCLSIHFHIDEAGGWLPVVAHCGRHKPNTKSS